MSALPIHKSLDSFANDINVDDFLEKFKILKCNHYPVDDILFMHEHPEIFEKPLISFIEKLCANYSPFQEKIDDLVFVVIFTLGNYRSKNAFPVLLKLLQLQKEGDEDIFGDTLTECFPPILSACFNEDFKAIRNHVMNNELDTYSRLSVMTSIAYTVTDGRLSATEAADFIVEIIRSIIDQNPIIQDFNMELIKLLLMELMEYSLEEVDKIFSDYPWILNKENIGFLNLEKEREYCVKRFNEEKAPLIVSNTNKYKENLREITEDGILSAQTWLGEKEEKKIEDLNFGNYDDESLEDLFLGSRYQNPLTGKKLGRNDPCICGSGKKYKKCCLN
jgi:uncharacterized protein YecA (UPF0149 family)